MSTAILFNGAAAYIAQEAGILDLLLSDVVAEDVRLNIDDVTFVGGLSSGALMTFAFNAAFGDNPKLSWDDFKENTLFTMTTGQVYTGIEGKTYDTKPLSQLLSSLTERIGYTELGHLPFDSAIVIRYSNLAFPGKSKNYWLTNITEVAEKLPSGELTVTKNIKPHQAKLELVSSLMCSTAIPVVFPPQELYYKDNLNVSNPIKNDLNKSATFIDGGVGGDDMVFSTYQEFFKIYNKHFDKIYFISPNFTKKDDETMQRISLEKGRDAQEEEPAIDPLLTMEKWTINFLKDIQAYNPKVDGGNLATTIYYCKPEIDGFNALDFSNERAQYNATIDWGKENPSKIAIDINSLTFS